MLNADEMHRLFLIDAFIICLYDRYVHMKAKNGENNDDQRMVNALTNAKLPELSHSFDLPLIASHRTKAVCNERQIERNEDKIPANGKMYTTNTFIHTLCCW